MAERRIQKNVLEALVGSPSVNECYRLDRLVKESCLNGKMRQCGSDDLCLSQQSQTLSYSWHVLCPVYIK